MDVRGIFCRPRRYRVGPRAWGHVAEVIEDFPENRIPFGERCSRITAELLPLIDLSQEDIDGIVGLGAPEVLATFRISIQRWCHCEEGILFHHLLGGEGILIFL